MQPCSIATRWMPPDRSIDQDTASGVAGLTFLDHGQLGFGEVLVPAELLQHAERELRIAVLDLGVLGVIAVAEQADLALGAVRQRFLALHAEAGAERAAAFLDEQVGVVEQRRAGMLELRRAPARPGQAVIVALVRTGRGLLREHVEVFLVRHVRLQPLRRLAAVAGGEAAAIDLAQNVLGRRQVVRHLDVLEHQVGEAKLLGEEIHHLVVVLRLEDRLDDLLAPLERAIGRRARAVGLVAGRNRQEVGAVLALRRQHRPGRGMRVGDHQQFELFNAFLRLRHARHGIAAVAHDEHGFDVVFLADLILRQQRCIEPAG